MVGVAVLATGQTKAPPAPSASSTAPKPVVFETDVQPIFWANCTGCHGADTRIKEMNLSTLEGVMKGSESGPVIAPGKPDESRLYQMVRDGKMPPGKTHLTRRSGGLHSLVD